MGTKRIKKIKVGNYLEYTFFDALRAVFYETECNPEIFNQYTESMLKKFRKVNGIKSPTKLNGEPI